VNAPAVRRTRAKRGSGELLRDEIVVAAKGLLANAERASDVPMRAVADAVGVTTPSI
jgi:AcrR family transcriptional regulator